MRLSIKHTNITVHPNNSKRFSDLTRPTHACDRTNLPSIQIASLLSAARSGDAYSGGNDQCGNDQFKFTTTVKAGTYYFIVVGSMYDPEYAQNDDVDSLHFRLTVMLGASPPSPPPPSP